MENLEEISILGTMIAAGVWYLKHKVVTSSKIQLEMLKEFERNKNQELLESFKSDLAIKSEIFKTKHLSIYERKLHALLDSFACVSDCESPMGKISEDWSTNNGAQFPKLYEEFLERKDKLLNTFWRNSALFSDSLIGEFQKFKIGTLIPYSNTYKNISESLKVNGDVSDSYIEHLIDLEIEYGKFSNSLKNEIRKVLNES